MLHIPIYRIIPTKPYKRAPNSLIFGWHYTISIKPFKRAPDFQPQLRAGTMDSDGEAAFPEIIGAPPFAEAGRTNPDYVGGFRV